MTSAKDASRRAFLNCIPELYPQQQQRGTEEESLCWVGYQFSHI